MHSLAHRPDRLSFVAIVMVAILSATVLFTVASLSSPSIALGASVYGASCDDVALRTRPSVASRRKAVIDSGKQVSVVSTVKGGSWTVTCAGRTTSGNTWYRINAVMGQKVSARYGVTYLYIATALVSHVNPASRYSACKNVGLRTRPSSSATRKAVIPMGTKVTVVAKVTGGSYKRSLRRTDRQRQHLVQDLDGRLANREVAVRSLVRLRAGRPVFVDEAVCDNGTAAHIGRRRRPRTRTGWPCPRRSTRPGPPTPARR